MNDTHASNASEQPGSAGRPDAAPTGPQGGSPAPMAPGDEAPPGTPGTGENTCPDCAGSGQQGGTTCPNCQGLGVVTVGIGGA